MSISQLRVGQGGSCEYRSNTINQEFVASQDYTNMKDWFNSNNVGGVIESSGIQEPDTGSDAVQNVYINTLATGATEPPFNNTNPNQPKNISAAGLQSPTRFGSTATSPFTTNYYRWYRAE